MNNKWIYFKKEQPKIGDFILVTSDYHLNSEVEFYYAKTLGINKVETIEYFDVEDNESFKDVKEINIYSGDGAKWKLTDQDELNTYRIICL